MPASEARLMLDQFDRSTMAKNPDRRWIRSLLVRASGGEALNTMQLTMLKRALNVGGDA